MFCKHSAVASLAATFVALGGGLISAQNTMTGGMSTGASQNSPSVGTSQSGEARPATTGASDEGRISVADPKKGGRIGPDGSLPKPKVKDDPQHRCLAPSGIC